MDFGRHFVFGFCERTDSTVRRWRIRPQLPVRQDLQTMKICGWMEVKVPVEVKRETKYSFS